MHSLVWVTVALHAVIEWAASVLMQHLIFLLFRLILKSLHLWGTMSIRLLLSHKKFPHADDVYWTSISMFLLFFCAVITYQLRNLYFSWSLWTSWYFFPIISIICFQVMHILHTIYFFTVSLASVPTLSAYESSLKLWICLKEAISPVYKP